LPPSDYSRRNTIPMAEPRSKTAARLAESPIADGGTAVEEWTGWGHDFPCLSLDACPGLTVVAPHPDDETLGVGATIATLCAAGVDVQVVSVSDGEAAYPGLDRAGRAKLKALRWAEVRRSMRLLGARDPVRLEMPDGELAQCESELTDRIGSLLADLPTGGWCATTWRGDGHPDHEAVGRAAAAATAATGAALVEYPVWMWHWARPRDPAVPWERARRVRLTAQALETKNLAAQCFPTQTQSAPNGYPVLPPAVVQRLLTVGEVVFV
jgi:LmbE family N-acetylglucosaminyl deacetylase